VTAVRDVTQLLGAVEILGPDAFRFAGSEPIAVHEPLAVHAGRDPGLPPLLEGERVAALQHCLYRQGYARRFTGRPRPIAEPENPDEPFVAELMRAHASRDRWDAGWRIYQVGKGGRVFVTKGDRFRAAPPGQFLIAGRRGMPPREGDEAQLRLEGASRKLQAHFIHLFGETPADQFDEFSLTRFYFHVSAQGAPNLVAALSRELNRFGAPFMLKCLDAPAGYDRADAFTLYAARRMGRIVAEIAVAVCRDLAGALRPEAPLFAKPLLRGLAAADDPGTGESFGMHRCRLTAEAIWRAWRDGSQGAQARLDALAAGFAREGLDLARPYLGAGMIDIFDPPPPGGLEL